MLDRYDIYCTFFCPEGPISLLNAKYETCKLATALIPTYRIMKRRRETMSPMKMAMNLIGMQHGRATQKAYLGTKIGMCEKEAGVCHFC
jgi:hypothetical protein